MLDLTRASFPRMSGCCFRLDLSGWRGVPDVHAVMVVLGVEAAVAGVAGLH